MSSNAIWIYYVVLIHSSHFSISIPTSQNQPTVYDDTNLDQHKISFGALPIDGNDTGLNSGRRTDYDDQNKPISVDIDLPTSYIALEQNKAVQNMRPEVVLEGGGVVQQSSTNFTDVDKVVIAKNDDSSHPTGSKGRKGVKYPGSSVPRKGADPSGEVTVPVNKTMDMSAPTNEQSVKDTSTTINRPTESPSKDNTQLTENTSHDKHFHKAHVKKPEVVSDAGDADEFDKYTIIKTSTTGEDYVIIGIVIVIGIWFSVFGALIFYRRAGEYWDRRHYRRMDFLVEGMYND